MMPTVSNDSGYQIGVLSSFILILADILNGHDRVILERVIWIVIYLVAIGSCLVSVLRDYSEHIENVALSSIAIVIFDNVIHDVIKTENIEGVLLWFYSAIMWALFSRYAIRRRARKIIARP